MDIKKNYNILLFCAIAVIVLYLIFMFANIKYNPYHVMKHHHDYPFSGYLLFFIFTCFWGVFVLGLFQLKSYLLGKERLLFVNFIFGALTLYLSMICVDFLTEPLNDETNKQLINFLPLITPSIFLMVFSWTPFAKAIHNKSKVENYEELRRKLGI